MADVYMEKLDLIFNEIAALKTEVAALKGTIVTTPPPSAGLEGLFKFVKPAVRDISQWPTDVDMTVADAYEAFQRSLHGVNWRGGHIADQSYEEAWAEIEALKSGDQALISKYIDLDPEFAGFGLLTGLFAVTKWDGLSFGVNANARRGYAGYTIQSFMDAQIAIVQGGGTPSGG